MTIFTQPWTRRGHHLEVCRLLLRLEEFLGRVAVFQAHKSLLNAIIDSAFWLLLSKPDGNVSFGTKTTRWHPSWYLISTSIRASVQRITGIHIHFQSVHVDMEDTSYQPFSHTDTLKHCRVSKLLWSAQQQRLFVVRVTIPLDCDLDSLSTLPLIRVTTCSFFRARNTPQAMAWRQNLDAMMLEPNTDAHRCLHFLVKNKL